MRTRLTALTLLLGALIASAYLGQLLTPPSSPSITLALMGDVMLGRGVAQAHREGGWAAALAELTPALQSADLALANLESPLAEQVPASVAQEVAAGEYNLCVPAKAVEALTAAGLDVLTLANNHTQDCGPDGLAESAAILREAGLTPLPPGEALFFSINGLRLALLAFDDVSAPLDIDSATQQIRAARQEGALVIVSLHWGTEYHPGASQRQQAIAQAMTDAGASVIWGHHPHVLQPIEMQGGGHDGLPLSGATLVAYSLGNALFDQISPPDAHRSALLLVTLDVHGVQDVQVVALQVDPLAGITRLADGATTEAVLHRLNLR